VFVSSPSFSVRLSRPLAAVVLGAALLAPLQPVVAAHADPSARPPASSAKTHARATQTALTAYGDSDSAGAVHLSGSLRWANGKVLGHREPVELWGRSGARWVLVRQAVTDRRGDVEVSVAPSAHTTYELRYAGSRSTSLTSAAASSRSPQVEVRALAHVRLDAPARAKRGQTFVVEGRVTPARAGRVVVLSGNGRTFTTLRTRADGTFSGRVRLQMKTTLRVSVPKAPDVDGAASTPRVVRVA
jgi:hypothetical protein